MKIEDIFSVKDKVALVTGGSRGVGEMIASAYLANGAKVYITARKAEACNDKANELSERYNAECISIPNNASTLDGIEELYNEISQKESKIDILVNNAGAAWGEPIEEFSELGWDKVMDLNVKSMFFVTQKFLPLLKKGSTKENPARVINIGSKTMFTVHLKRQFII
jgi:NAD(P)-dependent dehydrogenase (short-subunit alcohol dehydrogenase family)